MVQMDYRQGGRRAGASERRTVVTGANATPRRRATRMDPLTKFRRRTFTNIYQQYG